MAVEDGTPVPAVASDATGYQDMAPWAEEVGQRIRHTQVCWEQARGAIRDIQQFLQDRRATIAGTPLDTPSFIVEDGLPSTEASASTRPGTRDAGTMLVTGHSPSSPSSCEPRTSSPSAECGRPQQFPFAPSARSSTATPLTQSERRGGAGAAPDPRSSASAAAAAGLRWGSVQELPSSARGWAPTADSDELGSRRTLASQPERRESCASQGSRRGSRRSINTRRSSVRSSVGCFVDSDTVLAIDDAKWARYFESDDSDHGVDVDELPAVFIPKRRGGLSAEAHGGWNQRRASFRPDAEPKSAEQQRAIVGGLRDCPFFCNIEDDTLGRIADSMVIERAEPGQCIVRQGEVGRSGYLLLEGSCGVYDDTEVLASEQSGGSAGSSPGRGSFVRTLPQHRFFGEMTMLWGLRRTMSVYASEQCTLAKLKRDSYMGLVTRGEMLARTQREEILRRVEMFETLSDEHISQIADALEKKTFQKDEVIIQQGQLGKEFYVVLRGQCKATIRTGSVSAKADIQEHRRYHAGDLFGERALLHKTARAATITAVTQVEVLCLKRSRFERMLGPLEMLHQKNYLCDPRKSIADFYRVGDLNGPRGSLSGPPQDGQQTFWFAVYRPTSRDAIAKMLSGTAVGKGLNVKGKSAKKNRMSGFVPYLQISKEEHKFQIEDSVPGRWLTIYYTTKAAYELALTTLQEVEGASGLLKPVDRFQPAVYGLYLPEQIMRKAYILGQNISFLSGWETGRQSEPAFMDMNLHAVCETSEPEVALLQMDSENPMNPHALLIAYAEATVKPVVSDFDTFTVGSRGMQYDPLPPEQQSLAVWSLDNTEKILSSMSAASWNSRWLEVLKEANERGFHPAVPKYGFGDRTSYRLIEAVIEATRESGAVRHGAECFNFYFPQELDDEYLVVWEGFPDKPWAYMDEEDLRGFLLERAEDGFSFPLNPVWPVRDEGWYEVYEALWENESARGPLEAWYPAESGIRERIEAMHEAYPDGFAKLLDEAGATSPSTRISVVEDLHNCERADLALHKAKVTSQWNTARRKVQMATKVMSRLREASSR